MEKYKEKIEEDGRFKSVEWKDDNHDTLIVETEEGYIYEVTEKETKYLGKRGDKELEQPDLQESNIVIDYEPKTPTQTPVKVTITTERKEFTLQYSFTGESGSWEKYPEGGLTVDKNTAINARLINKIRRSRSVGNR